MIKRVPVSTYVDKCICDRCKEGEMLPTGNNMYLTEPPKFEHLCNKCNNIAIYTERYPVIKYEYQD